MIQEFISKEILPHVFRVFAPESCKQSFFLDANWLWNEANYFQNRTVIYKDIIA